MAEFIGANNGLPGKVTGTDGSGDDERSVVSAGGLTLRARPRAGVGPGDEVLVYLRPENLVVLPDGDGAGYDNVVDGTIERVIFEGPTAQLRVDVAGRELRVDVSGGRRLELIQRHGRVRLGFNDLTLIPVTAAAAPPPTS